MAILLMTLPAVSRAGQAPLRFAVTENGSMPFIRVENRQPTSGILFDVMQSLARQVGRQAEYHVMPRRRVQSALEQGEVDLHCYSAQAGYPDLSGNYVWSLPILYHSEWLVASADTAAGPYPDQFDNETVGAVLGYTYPALQTLFDEHTLIREDARTLDQALVKLVAGRYNYAVSSELILEWTNRKLSDDQRIKPIVRIGEQPAGCLARNDADLPTGAILRTLVRMRMSGEIQKIVQRYVGLKAP